MNPIQKILFPVDFSPSCVAMAPFVRRAAALTLAPVTLLHVVDFRASGFELYFRPLPEIDKDLKNAAHEKLDSFLTSEFPPNECSRWIVAGDAATGIAGLAQNRGFDLIVMPTHAGMFRRMLLGSTTAKVLNDSDCLVFTTQHAETIVPRELSHREWACAIGLSNDSERVLRYAVRIAEAFHANLTIIHVVSAAKSGPLSQLELEDRAQSMEVQSAHARIQQLQKLVGSNVPVTIAVGPIKDGLTQAARSLQADALVIGRSSQPGALGRLRDLTYVVIRDAPCPVVSV